MKSQFASLKKKYSMNQYADAFGKEKPASNLTNALSATISILNNVFVLKVIKERSLFISISKRKSSRQKISQFHNLLGNTFNHFKSMRNFLIALYIIVFNRSFQLSRNLENENEKIKNSKKFNSLTKKNLMI